MNYILFTPRLMSKPNCVALEWIAQHTQPKDRIYLLTCQQGVNSCMDNLNTTKKTCRRCTSRAVHLEGLVEKTLLPLDDLLDILQPIIPLLTRSNLHRCLKRNGISRLNDLLPEEEKRKTKPFKEYHPGFLHMDTAQINLAKTKYYLFVARRDLFMLSFMTTKK